VAYFRTGFDGLKMTSMVRMASHSRESYKCKLLKAKMCYMWDLMLWQAWRFKLWSYRFWHHVVIW